MINIISTGRAGSGAFSNAATNPEEDGYQPGAVGYKSTLNLNANNDGLSYGNPMKNHAAGDDIHPYSIRLLPILIY